MNPFLVPLNYYEDRNVMDEHTGITGLKLFFPYLRYDIEKMILENMKLQKLPHESRLWLLLYSLVCAGSYLHSNFVHHGDIRPHNVLINRNGKSLLVNPLLLKDELNQYQ